MKTDNLIIFVIDPVTNTSGRVLRSGRTSPQRSQRRKSAPPIRCLLQCNAKRLYQSSSNRYKRPIHKVICQTLIYIGKVLEYKLKTRSKDKIEIDVSNDDGGQSGVFVPSKESTCT